MHVLHDRPSLQRRYQVKALEYSPDGRYLLAGIERRQRDKWLPRQQGRLLIFDLRAPAADPFEHTGHGFLDVGWSADAKRVFAVTANAVQIVDHAIQRVRSADVFYAAAAEFEPDDRHLRVVLSRYGDGGLLRFEVHHDGKLTQLVSGRRSEFPPVSLAIDPNSGAMALGGHNRLSLCDLKRVGVQISVSQQGWVQHLAFSPDGHLLAAASGWRTVVWQVGENELRQRHELKGHGKEVTDLAFSPDGRLLLTTSLDGTVRMWDPGSGREVACCDWGTGAVRSVACHPDGTTAAVGGSRKASIVLFDLP